MELRRGGRLLARSLARSLEREREIERVGVSVHVGDGVSEKAREREKIVNSSKWARVRRQGKPQEGVAGREKLLAWLPW
jgi:hypothetical protein